jgi:GT2 family glycosyltransferase
MNRLRIVIVNYRTPGLVIDCLRSLEIEIRAFPDCKVVVVENGSGDDSADKLAAAIRDNGWGGWADLLVAPKNLGFAGGNNVALRPLLADPNPPEAVLLLNPDTVVRPGALLPLVEFLERHPKVGIVGSRLEDPDGTPQRSAFQFPSVLSELENGVRLGFVSKMLRSWLVAPPVRDQPHETDWMAGASMLVRREVFDAIGLMDEAYFLYFEETDFFRQAKRAGWSSWYVPASRVVHLVGQASGINEPNRPPKRVPRFWFESRRRYFVKNHGRAYALLASLAWAGGYATWRLRRLVQRKPDRDPPRLLWDFVRFNLLPL